MDKAQTRFVVITPVRDEAAHLEFTMRSMVSQSIRPSEWVIVDDGSTDRTSEIIDRYTALHSWITVIHRQNRGFRKTGGGVVEAFNDGVAALKTDDWEFIVKMDGDLAFEPAYFERCFEHFADHSRLGMGSGVICYVENGAKNFEICPSFHVRGASKIYRRACWESLGGLWPAPGWDTLDEVKANRLGWQTRSFPDLHLIHYRHTGAADGLWGGYAKHGRANYICGYHPVFLFAKCLLRLPKTPFVIGAAGILYGYLAACIARTPQFDDHETIGFLRRQQVARLLGKETIWK
jgi:poly-beta-1,6-N-acetyl-D-glucosamine synthase